MHKVQLNNKEYVVEFNTDESTSGNINNQPFELDLINKNESQYHLIKDNKSYCIDVLNIDYGKNAVTLKINGQLFEGFVQSELDQLLKEMGLESNAKQVVNELHAPMPGMVLDIHVEKGQIISKGEVLLVLEAMKMENNLKAATDAVIKEVHCNKGNTVNKGQLLITFE